MQLAMVVFLGLSLLYYLVWDPFQGSSRYTPNMLMIPLIAVAFVPTAYFEYKWQSTTHTGTRIVQETSGIEGGRLECQRLVGTLFDTTPSSRGYVRSDRPEVAVVKVRPCLHLQSYFASPKRPSMDESMAFMVLLHESIHVSGEYNESLTECRAHEVFIEKAVEVGTPRRIAQERLVAYLQQVYPNMASEYRSPDGCGGLHEGILRSSENRPVLE